jgi:benzoate membrane transport protein
MYGLHFRYTYLHSQKINEKDIVAKMRLIEKQAKNRLGLSHSKLNGRFTFLQDITSQNISSGLISSILVMTGPVLIILKAAHAGHFTDHQTINWIFADYFFSGILGIFMSLVYRIPITAGNTISGVAFLATVTSHITYPELIGGFVMSGLIIYIIGISGLFSKFINWVPIEVISAMLAGLVTSYVIQIIPSVKAMPLVGGPALFFFFICSRLSKRVPPILVAVIVAFITLFSIGNLSIESKDIDFFFPSLQMPEFSWMGLITLALPLAMLILSNDAAPGIGALQSLEFEPPIRNIISLSGLFSILAGYLGGQSANIAGMMTSICSDTDTGTKSKRYIASLLSGFLTLVFGISAWKIVPFIQSFPQAFVSLLAGFSLIGVLISSLQKGFSGNRYKLSALTSFLIALSQVSFLHISAPVWALILGAVVAKTAEK